MVDAPVVGAGVPAAGADAAAAESCETERAAAAQNGGQVASGEQAVAGAAAIQVVEAGSSFDRRRADGGTAAATSSDSAQQRQQQAASGLLDGCSLQQLQAAAAAWGARLEISGARAVKRGGRRGARARLQRRPAGARHEQEAAGTFPRHVPWLDAQRQVRCVQCFMLLH